jgi:AAA+ superfamily predicted ATPase
MSSPKELSSKFKFREIKVHCTDEWMAGSTKKYRRVFDRFETTYMREEISFFNKLFDEEEWEVSIRSKCYFVNGSQKNELSNFEEKRKILKDENIVYARHSWGKPLPGDYWKKGNYVWEAYLDEVKIGETTFYVEDIGPQPPGVNMFFDVHSVRLFEGDGQASALPDKKYLKSFSQKDSRFVWGEFNFINKVAVDYYAEIMFLYSDGDGQPKGSQSYLLYVPPNTVGKVYTAHAGWGNITPGTWHNDRYVMEILFMDTLVATVPFQVGESYEEGEATVMTDKGGCINSADHAKSTESPALDILLKDSLEELNLLTGLENIKTEVNEMVRLVQFYQETGKDVLNKFSLHTVFTGNPGTGKTTVARILSNIYKGLGILDKGHLVEVDREGLVAGYIGQTAIKTGEKINQAMGGILFIDEAYSLAQEKGSPYDFGGEAIQIILKRMEDMRGKFGVIVAGYTHNMHGFINSNPGLKSRFDKYFHFEDYTPDQMFVIALSMFRKEDVMPEVDAAAHLKAYFTALFEHRDEFFGNARTVRQVVAESVKNQHLRLAAMKKEDRTPDLISTILLDDVREFDAKNVKAGKAKIGFKK